MTKTKDIPLAEAKESALVESAEILEQHLGMIAAAIHRKDFEDAMVLASDAFGKAHSHAVNLKRHFLRCSPRGNRVSESTARSRN